MRKKISLTSLSIIFITSLVIFLWWNFGLFSSYNYFAAKRDIKNGNIKFVTFGLPIVCSKDDEIKMVMNKYGFKVSNIGCIVTNQEINAIETYNKVVEQYLTQQNGKNWRTTYQKEVDSLYKIAFDQQ
jgi:hypothetical protein